MRGRSFRSQLRVVATLLVIPIASFAAPLGKADLQVIRTRLLESLQVAPKDQEVVDALKYAETLGEDGRWPDVNYQIADKITFQAFRHFDRLHLLARAWAIPEASRGNPRLLAAFRRGLLAWDPDQTLPNWWWSDIGIPRLVEQALLLTSPALDPETLAHGDRILSRAKVEDPARPREYRRFVGQNLIWVLGVQIHRGVLLGEPERVQEAVKAVSASIEVVENGEGIQVDSSFHMHGPQLYSLGYGTGFLNDNADLARLVSGTALAFPREKTDLLTGLLLDGHAWFGRFDAVEPGASGRNVARPGILRKSLLRGAELLTGIGGKRDAELLALAKHLRGEAPPPNLGNRHFFRSDMMVQQEKAFTASVKMTSARTVGTECGNFENLLCDFQADGATFLFRHGKEYFNVYPVWDWRRIPGITSVAHPGEITSKPHGNGYKPTSEVQSRTSFVGGVSDGAAGLAAFDFVRTNPDPLSARKIWLLREGGLTAVGGALVGKDEDGVITTVNQCVRKGPVHLGGAEATCEIPDGETAFEGPCWIHHDGFVYVFPAGAKGRLRLEERSGSWKRINASENPKILSMPIFTLWLDHGVHPEKDSFSYSIFPADDLEAASARGRSSLRERIGTDSGRLSVTAEGLHGAAFFEAGTVDFGEGRRLTVDRPCLVLLRRTAEGWILSGANPVNEGLEVAITLEAPEGRTALSLTLPSGSRAGSTASRALPRSAF